MRYPEALPILMSGTDARCLALWSRLACRQVAQQERRLVFMFKPETTGTETTWLLGCRLLQYRRSTIPSKYSPPHSLDAFLTIVVDIADLHLAIEPGDHADD